MLAMNHYSLTERFISLLLGLFCFWDVKRGMSTGTIWMELGSIRRSDLAPLFWLGIVINIVVGLVCLLLFATGTDPWGMT